MAVTPYKQLEQEWQRLHAFSGALSLLRWDAAVMMPRGSADVRGEQLAAIETEQHALLTSPKVSRLLERAQAGTAELDDWQQANLREMQRQRDHAIATPVSLISRLARATSLAEVRWAEAREKQDFAIFAPHLEEVLHLVRDKAALLGQALNLAPYDALIDGFTPGLRSAEIDTVFSALVAAPADADPRGHRAPGGTCRRCRSRGKFAPGKQRALIIEVMKAFGFPFDRGRLDESDHPFTEGVAGDIRVTTKLDASRSVQGPAGRAARDRPCAVRPGRAARMAHAAGGQGARHGAGGKPVAADRDDHLPQPPLPAVPAAAAGEALRRQRPGVGAGQPLSRC